MSFLNILRMRFRELLVSPALLLIFLALPVMMGLIAGAANLRNQDANISLAVTDLDGTEISRGLISSLKRQGWDIREAGLDEIPRLLDGKAVEGALVIQRGFTARHDSLFGGGLSYKPAEGTLSTNMILDVVTYSVIPFKSRSVFLRQAKELYSDFNVPLPENFEESFLQRIGENFEKEAKQDFEFIGEYVEPPVMTYVVSDYSMEVLFLGFFALMGTFMFSSPAMRHRLSASPFGLRYDYTASLITLFIAGLVQILLYALSMRALMRAPLIPRELMILSVFLLMSLALSQALALLQEGLRLYLGLILLLLLSVAGGCFLQLPEQLIRFPGQYIPQGWALAALRGYPVPQPGLVIAISLLALLLLYPLHARRASRQGTAQ